jgi:hypothetical protein
MSREQLTAVYLDWFNNFVSIDGYASHYGLTYDEALLLIEVARMVANTPHPEA